MSHFKRNKFYVVYEGRKPGIYYSWIECAPHVDGYKGNKYESYDSYEQAETLYVNYCKQKGRPLPPLQQNAHYRRDFGFRHGEGPSDGPSRVDRMQFSIAEDTDSEDFVMQQSMQQVLEQVCNSLRIYPPTYTLHELKVINGREYRRYFASIQAGAIIGTPAVSIGRYGKDDYDAREDVAAVMLKRLMASTSRRIRDFNFYNVELLEAQLQKTMDDNLELEMEITMLNAELCLLNGIGGPNGGRV